MELRAGCEGLVREISGEELNATKEGKKLK